MSVIRYLRPLLLGGALISVISCGDDAAPTGSAPVATVQVSPETVSIVVGQVRQLSAAVMDAGGRQLAGRRVNWISENAAVVSVDSAGLTRGLSVGTTRVIAESEGHRDTAVVVVAANSGGTLPELEVALSGYVGASVYDVIRDVTTDAQGNVYITGGTTSPDFPTTPGVVQRTHNPGTPDTPGIQPADVFIVKLSPAGQVIWSTFLGGPNHDRAYGIEVDAQGFVYIAGRAGRAFPVTSGAFQTTFQGGGTEAAGYGPQDGLVCKLKPDASAVVFCSYFGTNDSRPIRDIAVNSSGDMYVVTSQESGTYPAAIANAFTNTRRGGEDAVIAKIKGDGSAVLWATYVGGSADESHQNSVRLDAAQNPYMLLTTESSNMPATAGAYQRTYGGNSDLFIAKFNPQSGAIVWGTYLGASQNESTETHEFAVDAQGNCYVATATTSPNFPTTPGAFQRTFGGGTNDVFAAKISSDGSQLLGSTLIGGSSNDRAEGVTVDAQGQMFFTGTTTSTNFPVTPDAFQKTLNGARDAFMVKVSADFTKLLYSSYIGGNGEEYGRTAAFGTSGYYFAGETVSTNWPSVGGFKPAYSGLGDAFFLRLVLGH